MVYRASVSLGDKYSSCRVSNKTDPHLYGEVFVGYMPIGTVVQVCVVINAVKEQCIARAERRADSRRQRRTTNSRDRVPFYVLQVIAERAEQGDVRPGGINGHRLLARTGVVG